MRAVDLDDCLHNTLFDAFHTVKFFIENTACSNRIDGFEVIALPLNVHHDGEGTLGMAAFFRGNFMGTCNGKVASCPQADIIRQGAAGTDHKVCDALKAGQLHIISIFRCLFLRHFFCRGTARLKTSDHIL